MSGLRRLGNGSVSTVRSIGSNLRRAEEVKTAKLSVTKRRLTTGGVWFAEMQYRMDHKRSVARGERYFAGKLILEVIGAQKGATDEVDKERRISNGKSYFAVRTLEAISDAARRSTEIVEEARVAAKFEENQIDAALDAAEKIAVRPNAEEEIASGAHARYDPKTYTVTTTDPIESKPASRSRWKRRIAVTAAVAIIGGTIGYSLVQHQRHKDSNVAMSVYKQG